MSFFGRGEKAPLYTGPRLPRQDVLNQLAVHNLLRRETEKRQRIEKHTDLELERAGGSLASLSERLLTMLNTGELGEIMKSTAQDRKYNWEPVKIDLGSYLEFNNQSPGAEGGPHFTDDPSIKFDGDWGSDYRARDAIFNTKGYKAIKKALIEAQYDYRAIYIEDVIGKVKNDEGKECKEVIDRRIILEVQNRKPITNQKRRPRN